MSHAQALVSRHTRQGDETFRRYGGEWLARDRHLDLLCLQAVCESIPCFLNNSFISPVLDILKRDAYLFYTRLEGTRLPKRQDRRHYPTGI